MSTENRPQERVRAAIPRIERRGPKQPNPEQWRSTAAAPGRDRVIVRRVTPPVVGRGIEHPTEGQIERTTEKLLRYLTRQTGRETLAAGRRETPKVAAREDEPLRSLPTHVASESAQTPADVGRGKVDALWTSAAEAVATAGRDLLGWLDHQSTETSEGVLAYLTRRVDAGWMDKTHQDNDLAALEILVLRGTTAPWGIVLRQLSVRPISELHLYLVPLARLRPSSGEGTLTVLATEITHVFDDAIQHASSLPPRLVRGLSVEVFRTLADISPGLAIGEISRHLPSLTGIEQTALWEAAALAVARAPITPDENSALAAAATRRWQGLLAHQEPDTIDNFPGLTACILGILGRCTGKLGPRIAELTPRSRMRTRVLAQLVQRPLGFLDAAARADLYSLTLRALADEGQVRTVAAISSIVARDLPAEFKRILHGAIAPIDHDSL